MKAMLIDDFEKPLHMTEVPDPQAGADDVVIAIEAASANPLDYKIQGGKMANYRQTPMPLILGQDCAGVISAVGENVQDFKVGDKVYSRVDRDRLGTFAEYIAVKAANVAIMPDNLSFGEAAALPVTALTAYQALHDYLQIQPGEKILIQGGSGGVGTIAIQMAKSAGAYVAVTAGSACDLLVSLGANEVINYKEQNFEDVLKDFDAVFDAVGGEILQRSFTVIRRGGRIVTTASATPMETVADLISGKKAYYKAMSMQASGAQLAEIARLVEAGKVRPIIDRVFLLKDADKALEYIASGESTGKVIVKVR